MDSMTHREYRTRLAWLEERWKEPDRTDHYLMQIAQEVRRVLSKKPGRIKLKDFLIGFTTKKESKERSEKEALKEMERSKSVWGMVLGKPIAKQDQAEQDG